MPTTIAFDVYGTLIDTHGLVTALEKIMGDQARAFSQTWREKQLEYSFRRGLMQKYSSFAVCTSNALDYACSFYEVDLSQQQKNNLLESYQSLPVFKDVEDTLSKLKTINYRLFAFSNGTANAIDTLLVAAEIRNYFTNTGS